MTASEASDSHAHSLRLDSDSESLMGHFAISLGQWTENTILREMVYDTDAATAFPVPSLHWRTAESFSSGAPVAARTMNALGILNIPLPRVNGTIPEQATLTTRNSSLTLKKITITTNLDNQI